MQLKLFDACCALGPMTVPQFGQEFTTAPVLEHKMREVGIAAALVYTSLAYEYDPAAGNEWLMNAISGYEKLHPCWVLLPPATGEMPLVKPLLATMEQEGVRAARLCPSPARNNFSLESWCSGPLLSALAEARIPLFLDLEEASWSQIAGLLSSYPTLPLVLTRVTYRIDRYLYPLLERYEMLHVELSGYQGLHAIESVVKRFGPERLLFGTQLPVFDAGATITHLCYAAISEEAKALIAHGNLERLLNNAYAK